MFFDDIVSDAVAPPWLQAGAYGRGSGVGGRYLQTFGLELDTIFARAKYAAYNGLPSVCDPSAIPLLCADRVIYQGPSESTASITVRLMQAFDNWRIAGGDWGVLREVLSLFSGFGAGIPSARIVDDVQTWSYYGANPNLLVPPLHTASRSFHSGQWNWDNDQEWTGLVPTQLPWYRYWLILDVLTPVVWTTTEGAWGDPGNWGDTTESWGLGQPATFFQSMQAVIRARQQAGAWCRWIVVNFAANAYDPNLSNTEPDGTWSHWGKLVSGVRVQARDLTARFVDGVAEGH